MQNKKISSKLLLFIFFFFVGTLLSSCWGIQVDTLPVHQTENSDLPKEQWDRPHQDRIGKKIALFPVHGESGVPKSVLSNLDQQLLDFFSSSGFFEQILSGQELENTFQKDGELRQLKDIYLDTLYAVSLSDRDLSNPMGKKLGMDSFLVYHVAMWPCTDCFVTDVLYLKFHIIEAATGNVIWMGSQEVYDLLPESEETENKAYQTTDEMTLAFYNRFKQKWHQKRFQNLSLLAR